MSSYTPPVGQQPARRARPLWLRSAIITACIVAVLFVIEAIDVATYYDLDQNGIVARQVDGLDGILWAPLLHGDWQHLLANLMPGAVLCFLVLMTRRFLIVTGIIWVVSGVGVWLFAAPYSITVGASGIVFGWLTFLIVRGLFNRDLWQILGGLVLFLVYGSILWGVLPSEPLVSWQAHLFGAMAGVFAAWALAARDRRKPAVTAPGVAP
ncbi:rhomboid family intramembrane serine protease [Gordonia sp. SCSIO 19800]|uniref:rhomboid family intramembrane serine protease n=1 Tax=Gordonia sp. SCSIO 19800 TaxID=2826926 RepID=UPI001B812C54|nr:rhomboid family intramembrane serine protease [Gordonia sp. SCSIO 19800]MBR7191988.1 rhomboid family intramembrane serine protease [Gordonia sp. SCSIO 19800]